MSVHTKRVLSVLTAKFLAAEIKEIVKVVETFPNPNEVAVGDLTIAEFRNIQLTFHGSRRMMKEFCELYVGRFLRGYMIRFGVSNPVDQAELLASTEANEWAAADLLVEHYKKERGEVSPEDVANIDTIVDGIQQRMRSRIEAMRP